MDQRIYQTSACSRFRLPFVVNLFLLTNQFLPPILIPVRLIRLNSPCSPIQHLLRRLCSVWQPTICPAIRSQKIDKNQCHYCTCNQANTFDTARLSSPRFRISFLLMFSSSASLRLLYLPPCARLSADRTADGETNSSDALMSTGPL